jgi:hypothetical protein
MTQVPPQAVQAPHDEDIDLAALGVLHEGVKGGPGVLAAADSPIDSRGSRVVFMSTPFKRPERLLHILVDPPGGGDEWNEMAGFTPSDRLMILANIVDFDPTFGAAVLRTYAERLNRSSPQHGSTGDNWK